MRNPKKKSDFSLGTVLKKDSKNLGGLGPFPKSKFIGVNNVIPIDRCKTRMN